MDVKSSDEQIVFVESLIEAVRNHQVMGFITVTKCAFILSKSLLQRLMNLMIWVLIKLIFGALWI